MTQLSTLDNKIKGFAISKLQEHNVLHALDWQAKYVIDRIQYC